MKCYIIAGPNGAGKTTFAENFLPVEADCLNFINADLIARGIAPFNPESVALEAGKLFLKRMNAFPMKKWLWSVFNYELLKAGTMSRLMSLKGGITGGGKIF